MTSEQMQLVEVPPVAAPLTDRQSRALETISSAGFDGVATDELGASVHAWQGRHTEDDRCVFCSPVGTELGRRLRELGYVRQRRRKAPGGDHYMVWVTVDAKPEPKSEPFGLPEGF